MVHEKKVSVLMLTYQHEAFVAAALDSAVSQTTNFDYELVIGDDGSRDRTREILLDYQKRHPEKIKLLLHDSNQGVMENLRATLDACRGEMVAILEGDDFWCHPRKLQRQVDLFDAHSNISLCGHQSITLEGDQQTEGSTWPHHQHGSIGVKEAFAGTLFHTCTMMFRRALVAALPGAFWSIFPPDRALQIILAQAGDVAFIRESMAAYRIHPGGIWSAKTRRERREINLEFFRRIGELTAPCHHTLIRDEIYRRWRSQIRETAREGRYLEAWGHYASLLGSPRIWLHDPKPMASRSLWK